MVDKAALRREIAAKKRAMTGAQILAASENLALQLFAHPLYQRAVALYAYLSYNQEVRTQAILRQAAADGKRLAVPKITDGRMEFLWLTDRTRLEPGFGGIPEPVEGERADAPDALVLMPGLAFDRQGHRMGYGGGYYDRFLAREPHPTIALCFDFQLLDCLPTEDHDIPVDVVLSAKTMEALV